MILELDTGEGTMRDIVNLSDDLDEVGLTGMKMSLTVTLDCPDDRVEEARRLARECIVFGDFVPHTCKPCGCVGSEAA